MSLLIKYFRGGLVQIFRNRLTSIFLVIGFSSGMAVSLFALLIWDSQQYYDSRVSKSEDFFRITTRINSNWHFATSPFTLYEELGEKLPVKSIYQMVPAGSLEVSKDSTGDSFNYSVSAGFVTRGFLERLSINLIDFGLEDPNDDPHGIFITSTLAQKVFGRLNVYGENLAIRNYGQFVVRGIINEETYNYHFDYDVFLPAERIRSLVGDGALNKELLEKHNYLAAFTYVEFDRSNRASLQSRLEDLTVDYSRMFVNDVVLNCDFILSPLDNIFYDNLIQDTSVVLNQPNFRLYLIIAIALLVLSAANYFNIQVFSLMKRLKEFGIRKVHGANSFNVTAQIVVENIVLVFMSLIVAVPMLRFLPLPGAQEILMESRLSISLFALVASFALLIGVLTAIIPSVVVTRKVAMYSINGVPMGHGRRRFGLSGLLLISQLIVSIIFVYNFILVEKQTEYIMQTDYGFRLDRIITSSLSNNSKPELLRTELEKDSRVERVGFISKYFGSSPEQCRVSLAASADYFAFDYYSIDETGLGMFELELLEGENIQSQSTGQELTSLVNEQALRQLQLSMQDAVGQELVINDTITTRIVGIVKDFHYNNLKHAIRPLIFRVIPQEFKLINVKLAKGVDEAQFIQEVTTKVAGLNGVKLEFESYGAKLKDRLSHADDRIALGLIGTFVVTITCLGIVGVILGNAERTKKTVAINKLCGANSYVILSKLFGQYIRILLISLCIAIPPSYLIGNIFLSQFAYRISVGLSHFGHVTLLSTIMVLVPVALLVNRYFRLTIIEGIKRD